MEISNFATNNVNELLGSDDKSPVILNSNGIGYDSLSLGILFYFVALYCLSLSCGCILLNFPFSHRYQDIVVAGINTTQNKKNGEHKEEFGLSTYAYQGQEHLSQSPVFNSTNVELEARLQSFNQVLRNLADMMA
ncbi:hypothetical protein P8452_03578 [Trifolium repens]|nr:hypothetical protein QL285_003811 [Trifolium repens]WJX13153.1 hypothetical protein P8452_03578 [Trifolium repens]